jgi:type I restriction enzyme R subunit
LRDAFNATDSDVYDLLRFIKFDKQVISRKMRVDTMDKSFVEGLDAKNKEFIDFVLDQYERNGFEEFNDLTNLLNLKYGNTSVVNELGGVDAVRKTFATLQELVYRD